MKGRVHSAGVSAKQKRRKLTFFKKKKTYRG